MTPTTIYAGTRRRGLQVHDLRRHLGRRQHGPDDLFVNALASTPRPPPRSMRAPKAESSSPPTRRHLDRRHQGLTMEGSRPWPSISTARLRRDVARVFKSTDSGGTWAAANTGLSNVPITGLVIDPSTPATLYAHAAGSSSPPTPGHLGPARTLHGPWPSIPRPPPRSTPGRRRGLQVHRLRRHLGRRQHRPPVRLRPGDRSRDPRHALRRDVRRGLQVHRLRRHLGRRQREPSLCLVPGYRCRDARHHLRGHPSSRRPEVH